MKYYMNLCIRKVDTVVSRETNLGRCHFSYRTSRFLAFHLKPPLLGPSPLIIPPPSPKATSPHSFTMEGQNENDELYPIAVLIDELKVHSEKNYLRPPLC